MNRPEDVHIPVVPVPLDTVLVDVTSALVAPSGANQSIATPTTLDPAHASTTLSRAGSTTSSTTSSSANELSSVSTILSSSSSVINQPCSKPSAATTNSTVINGQHNGSPTAPATQDGIPGETIKTKPSRWELLVHFFAVTATLVVILLNVLQVYWEDLERHSTKRHGQSQNAQLKYLQLAAKAHETSMMGSLSIIIVSHVIRLVLNRGIPYGLLDAPYMIGAGGGFSVLFHARFWIAAWSSWRSRLLALGLFLCIILTQLVGPSSAIAMIPSLAWWSTNIPNRRIYYSGENAPISISPWYNLKGDDDWSVAKDALCFGPDPGVSLYCPVGGLDAIDNWITANYHIDSPKNFTMPEPFSVAQRTLLSYPLRGPEGTVTTVPTSIDAAVMGLYWRYSQESTGYRIPDSRTPSFRSAPRSSVYQPLVYSECSSTVYWPRTELQYPNMVVPWLNRAVYSGQPYVDKSDTILADLPSREARFAWRTADNYSTIAIFVIPREDTDTTIGKRIQTSWVVTCAVDARWAPATVSFEPRNSMAIKSNISKLDIFSRHNTTNPRSLDYGISADRVVLPKRLLETLDADLLRDGSITKRMEFLLSTLTETTISNNSFLDAGWAPSTDPFETEMQSINAYFSSWIGAIVADALARYTYMLWDAYLETHPQKNIEEKYVRLNEYMYQDVMVWMSHVFGGKDVDGGGNVTAKQEAYFMELEEMRYGYGYGFEAEDTASSVIFACVVLGIYILTVIVHVLVLMSWWWKGTYRRSSLWEEMQGVVNLGLISDHHVFADRATVKEKRAEYRLRVRIRDDDGVKLVHGDRDVGSRIDLAKKRN